MQLYLLASKCIFLVIIFAAFLGILLTRKAPSGIEVKNSLSLRTQCLYVLLEKAHHTILNQAKREHDIRKGKIRNEFGNTLEGNLGVTQFYDIYTVGRYKKYLNALRRFYVNEFNEQVLKPIAQKNKWEVMPTLTFGHFQKDDEIEQAIQDFKEQKMYVSGFITAVVKKP